MISEIRRRTLLGHGLRVSFTSVRRERPFECADSKKFPIVNLPLAERFVDARPSATFGSRFSDAS